MILLEAQGLKKRYKERELLRGISLTLSPGEKLAITGRSGSGKTTLLHLLSTLDSFDEGILKIEGEVVSEKRALLLRKETFGFLFQFHYLIPELTVRENILLPIQIARKPLPIQRMEELLDRFQLVRCQHQKAALLSGGERQRAALIRASIHQPKLLFADEPTGNLDPENAKIVIDYLLQEIPTLILVTHEKEVAKQCKNCFELKEGMLIPC